MVNPINWRELDLAIYGYLYIYIGIGFEVVDGGLARPDVSINRDVYIGMAGARVPKPHTLQTYGRVIETVSPALDALVTLTVMPSTVTLSPTARGACRYRGSVDTEFG